ncbi:MAG: hypothetical protein GWP61_00900 [Chloroflexi bacterium]|jgi:hypothetical protein|nr:hypothetical protein [Chloroflexota bacterium]
MTQVTSSTPTETDEHLIAAAGEPIVNITAYTARQKASGYVGGHISHMMGGGEPSLVLSRNRLVWRVPILLTSPSHGTLGVVGNLDVDARTGQLLASPDFADQVKAYAQTLVDRSTS